MTSAQPNRTSEIIQSTRIGQHQRHPRSSESRAVSQVVPVADSERSKLLAHPIEGHPRRRILRKPLASERIIVIRPLIIVHVILDAEGPGSVPSEDPVRKSLSDFENVWG